MNTVFVEKTGHLQRRSFPGLVFLHPLLQHWFFGPEIWEQIAGVAGPTLAESPVESGSFHVLLKKLVFQHLGVSINGGTPKWMVYTGKNPIKMGDLGVPPFQETSTGCSIVMQLFDWKYHEDVLWTQFFNACRWPDLLENAGRRVGIV